MTALLTTHNLTVGYTQGKRVTPLLSDLNLTMHQGRLIALLGQYLDFIPVEDMKNDKPVAPTTINNYVRLKVMPAPEKRKYYRIHIAYLIMIFTLKQGASINGIQKILPPPDAREEEVRTFYTGYIEQLRTMCLLYIDQIRGVAQEVLDPNRGSDAAEALVIKCILISALARITGEKLLRLKNADPEAVLAQEKLNDEQGLHPMIPPLEGEG